MRSLYLQDVFEKMMSLFKASHIVIYIFFIVPVLTGLTFRQIRLEHWMHDLPEELKELPLIHLAIPGSHDSMTYGIDYWSDLAPDAPEGAKNFIANWFHQPIKGWSITQNINIQRQLEIGIRYFDLRVATQESQPNKFFFTHAYYAGEVFEQLNLIKVFLSSHPKEVVILDFKHLHGFNENNHRRFMKELIETFEELIHKFHWNMKATTLSRLNKDQKQVIIIYQHKFVWLYGYGLFWKNTHIVSPWPQTDNTHKLITFLRQNIKKRPLRNAFYVTQGIVTASVPLITKHLFQSLHGCCAEKVMNELIPFIEEQKPGPAPNGAINIVIADFVHIQDAWFPKTVIRLNDKLLKPKIG